MPPLILEVPHAAAWTAVNKLGGEVMPDHVHLFVAADPTRSVAEIVNRFKA